MQKVSGYLPKSGRYTEIFRIINSYAASPDKQSIRSFRVVVQPNINGIENGLVNATFKVIDSDRADLSVLTLAKILR